MKSQRDLGLAYILLVVGGFFGAHKFYLNRPVMGVVYFFTGGLFIVGLIIDVFTLPEQVARCNRDLAAEPVAPACDGLSHEALIEATRRVERFSQRLENLETLVYARKRG